MRQKIFVLIKKLGLQKLLGYNLLLINQETHHEEKRIFILNRRH